MKKKKNKKSLRMFAVLLAIVATIIMVPALTMAGDLEPTAPPGPTMKTLNEIPPTWSQTLSASDRFELVLNNEAVLDKETGLVWAKNANISNDTWTWQEAVIINSNRTIGNRKGWRLPMVEELASLVDDSQSNPALPLGHPFDNVQTSNHYWSATTAATNAGSAFYVRMDSGTVGSNVKGVSGYVWPVRGGAGPILVPHTP